MFRLRKETRASDALSVKNERFQDNFQLLELIVIATSVLRPLDTA